MQSDIHEPLGYPFTSVLVDNTPEHFKASLEAVKKFLQEDATTPPIVTINSWNEWTEGSYIEPDTVHGMAYLEAIRDVIYGK
ncbi:glycoside hydrolase family 99-like domain-containing protein [Cohnella silvisoli]|uniref:Glycoside hydrolase family 99-like domain-containing protein n=1 Tax=Cohnella silvisoli TaxID=2873699 RepID=A0ABV1L6C7_9BACL|nr:glycoside hydrolase family 99-like domain-containing protein [Cohnella silvisoli]MCD9026434.1 glycoside hydrolase family 99-like domain-containing protein [Cohnella silvisoli]